MRETLQLVPAGGLQQADLGRTPGLRTLAVLVGVLWEPPTFSCSVSLAGLLFGCSVVLVLLCPPLDMWTVSGQCHTARNICHTGTTVSGALRRQPLPLIKYIKLVVCGSVSREIQNSCPKHK